MKELNNHNAHIEILYIRVHLSFIAVFVSTVSTILGTLYIHPCVTDPVGKIDQKFVPSEKILWNFIPFGKMHWTLIPTRKNTKIIGIPTGFVSCKWENLKFQPIKSKGFFIPIDMVSSFYPQWLKNSHRVTETGVYSAKYTMRTC